MILISNLTLYVKDGSTIASTEIYGADKKTYINIGSGNVFKLEWETPTLTNDTVDRYSLVIKRHDTTLNVYYDILNKNIGLVNEFYVDSALLPVIPEQYMLSIYLVAYGKLGTAITSNVVNPYVSKGSGAYVKVSGYTDNAGQEKLIYKRAIAIMKRALVLGKVALTDSDGDILKDIDGRTLFTADAPVFNNEVIVTDRNGQPLISNDEKTLLADFTAVLVSTEGWSIVREGYTKDATGTWRANDIRYEVLVDQDDNIITDENNEPIYVL